MSKHMVGSTWIGVSEETGRKCYIWLAERNKKFEKWAWKIVRLNNEEDIFKSDWTTSYRLCLVECDFKNPSGKKIIFEKVEQ